MIWKGRLPQKKRCYEFETLYQKRSETLLSKNSRKAFNLIDWRHQQIYLEAISKTKKKIPKNSVHLFKKDRTSNYLSQKASFEEFLFARLPLFENSKFGIYFDFSAFCDCPGPVERVATLRWRAYLSLSLRHFWRIAGVDRMISRIGHCVSDTFLNKSTAKMQLFLLDIQDYCNSFSNTSLLYYVFDNCNVIYKKEFFARKESWASRSFL